MDRQATQPAAVPSGRKRRRVSKKQKQEEEAQARALQMKADHDQEMAELGLSRTELLEMKATQPPTGELVIALNALPKAADLTPLPTPSPTDQSVNELMEGTLKDYKEECVEEGTFHSDPTTEVGEWEVKSSQSLFKHGKIHQEFKKKLKIT